MNIGSMSYVFVTIMMAVSVAIPEWYRVGSGYSFLLSLWVYACVISFFVMSMAIYHYGKNLTVKDLIETSVDETDLINVFRHKDGPKVFRASIIRSIFFVTLLFLTISVMVSFIKTDNIIAIIITVVSMALMYTGVSSAVDTYSSAIEEMDNDITIV